MIRWCAYCQRYLGEAPPFERYTMTHGVCNTCVKKSASIRSEQLTHIRRIGSFYSDLRKLALKGDTAGIVTSVAKEASALGLRSSDLFMGVIQPILYEIGEAWVSGTVSVAQEHAFSSFAEQLLSLVPAAATSDHSTSAVTREVDALLVCSNGNFHTLGVRILSLALSESGIRTSVSYPGLPNDAILTLIRKCNPPLLGVSVSLPEQRFEVEALIELISGQPMFRDLKVLVGGTGVKLHAELWQELPQVVLAPSDMDELIEVIRAAVKFRTGVA